MAVGGGIRDEGYLQSVGYDVAVIVIGLNARLSSCSRCHS